MDFLARGAGSQSELAEVLLQEAKRAGAVPHEAGSVAGEQGCAERHVDHDPLDKEGRPAQ